MKENFFVKIETIHLPDRGTTENAHGLPPEELARRDVVDIDIANDNEFLHAGDITPATIPSKFVSSKTGRGPLTENWQETVEPVMCAYKLVSVHFKWFGLQKMVESYTHTQYPRLFSKFHREVFCWIDKWHGLTMEDIRAIEAKAQKELEEQRKTGTVSIIFYISLFLFFRFCMQTYKTIFMERMVVVERRIFYRRYF
ncbi:unnamed protein product [Cylicostephanus goldi]|uniref:Phosphatidylinositol transfer protein N-terminal domain-containing protein n=1 Tax=Cylicostephanus goldi TaxID=71465 RepID=A0A3P6R1A0_CYLGO|nr:unnamed protein product [Cylicostephanus goldi]